MAVLLFAEEEEEQESLQLSYTIMEEHIPLSFSRSLSASASASEKQSIPSDAVIFFGLSLALGIACRHRLRGTKVPYTVALLIIGIAIGSLGSHFPPFSSSPSSSSIIIIIIVGVVVYIFFLVQLLLYFTLLNHFIKRGSRNHNLLCS